MTDILLSILSGIFDIILLHIFFQYTLKERRDGIPKAIYPLCFVIVESILVMNIYLFTNTYNGLRTLLILSCSSVLTFALTFFYTASFRNRIYTTLIFQLFASFGEILSAALLMLSISDQTHVDDAAFNIKIAFGSKIVIFIFVCVYIAILNRNSAKYTTQFNIAVLLTPIVTFGCVWIFPYEILTAPHSLPACIILLAGLASLNIINFYLFHTVLNNYDLQETLRSYQAQIYYQSEKYSQIASAYKSTRRIVHDTKKHAMYIRTCVQKHDFEKITDCTNQLIHDLDTVYIKVNTGNLVIDTFVGNAFNLAQKDQIHLETDIRVNAEDIPLQDYDLCVILGNLIDNSLQACRKMQNPTDRYINIQIVTQEKYFLIHLQNPLTADITYEENDKLFHGYGINNVKELTEKNGGTYVCTTVHGAYDTSIVFSLVPTDSHSYKSPPGC